MRNVKASKSRTPAAAPATTRTPEEARADLEKQGISIAEWARSNGLRYSTVYQVITGQKKGRRGDAHRAAVLLRIKAGTIIEATAGASP